MKRFLSIFLILALMSMFVTGAALAQEVVEEELQEVVEEEVEEVEEVEKVVETEVVDEVVEEGLQEVVEEVVDEVVEEGIVEEVEAADIESQGALPGSFTSQIIAIANLNESGSAETAALTLDEIGGAGTGNVTSAPVYPGGASFINSADLPSDGEFSGVLSSAFPAAAVVLNTNSAAGVADAYPGLGSTAVANILYGTLIFNRHSSFESILYCQNAGSADATIDAELYKTGEATARVTLTSASLAVGEGVKWDIADDATVQAAWPGGDGEFGYARFSSAGNIACVVDNQRLASPYVQSLFQAVPSAGFSSTDLRLPLIFNGHGASSTNVKGRKWNTGISFVNTNAADATVEVEYTASTGYVNTCTGTIPANGSGVWYAPEAGASGDFATCTGGPLSWSYPGGPTFGAVRVTVTSGDGVLAIANANRYDTGLGLGAGYSGLGAAPSGATNRAVCALAFNRDAASDWITGIQAANVGTGSADVSFTMVRAGADPASNSVTISKTGVAAGSSATAYFPQETTALTSFEGAVFVEASAGALIAVSSSNTNYNTLGAAALYDCVNY